MMTGLMYNKPDDPVDFMLRALHSIRRSPNQKVTWDMFVENPPPPLEAPPSRPGIHLPVLLGDSSGFRYYSLCFLSKAVLGVY